MNTITTSWTACMGRGDIHRIGMVARWRPVHLGQEPILRAMCECADHAVIGIGSANRYNARNPFTLSETEDMLHLVMQAYRNYEIIRVPDLDDGPRWRELIVRVFGHLDVFLSANPYVTELLQRDYDVQPPVRLVSIQDRKPIEGAMVRRLMAQNGNWETLVPACVADYIHNHRLDQRFRDEFGLETLAMDSIIV